MSEEIEIQLPVAVIVGRPNVGKSTLFNRVIGEQAAIVEDRPGVTRDRKELEANWLGHRFMLVDTGGWMPGGSELDAKVSRQVEAAVRNADLVIFVVDGSVGVTDDDELMASWLRKSAATVMLVVNKADNDRREADRWDFLSLGLGDPYPVSALHGRRAGDLLDEVIVRMPSSPLSEEYIPNYGLDQEIIPVGEQKPPRVALVGRPNVGKSTLFNRLVGEDRAVVHDMPGTTRDSIDTLVETEDGPVVFVDTAGMRRRSRIDDSAEYYSLVRALRAVDGSDIALFVIDATQGITAQDQRLAERIDAAGCPIVIMLNKWELIDDAEERERIDLEVKRKLYFVDDAPVLKVSALTGKGVHKLRPVLQEAILQYHRRIPTRDVNRVIADAQQRQAAGGGARVMYALQGATDPPTFTLFVNRELPHTYLRYLERSIREAFNFGSTPLKLRVRKRAD
ncbi:MAG: ribosome biogenesis GTPase Der [Ilumatobacteraceae bacterium]|jgi:GTP-binding protein|nr:ribosome biogenesis GTPase Der [Actinomycetota bacterium]MDP4648560.1 ribosome biogenesis GTPase Der [Ilumatobacteraceae bacterium]MDA3020334.1 ribosome biogenesis GTPase Der [Actinomycetota bacterium]MDP4705076.1 ribosome biogenesis GTPase Der [Ilumatobacteraceae bacterium]MDP4712708.1 ribosome biogenesis GTPase Der [Ilumatobacteraceae bacterium]